MSGVGGHASKKLTLEGVMLATTLWPTTQDTTLENNLIT